MSADRDVSRIVRSWLREDEHESADRVLGIVLDQLDTTPQRRAWWPARRATPMTYARLAIPAAAVLVVAVIGYQFLPRATGSVGDGPTGTARPTATAQPTSTPVPTQVSPLPKTGSLAAGTYRVNTEPPFLVTVPAGWVSTGTGVRKNVDKPNEVALDVWTGNLRVFADACRSEGTDKPVGPKAADLLAALRAQKNSDVSDPVDANVGGVTGMRLEISAPADLNVSGCSIGSLQIWVTGDGSYYAGLSPDTPPEPVYIADAPGGRFVYHAGGEPAATAADIAELDAIVASIEIIE